MRKIYYTGQDYRFHIGYHLDYKHNEKRETYFVMRRWGNCLVEAQPRFGKSSLIKDLIVKISKKRKVVIFDYNGEWEGSVLKYNRDIYNPPEFEDRMVGVKVLKNFTFKLTDFNSPEDFMSMGFQHNQVHLTCDLIQDTLRFHKGDVQVVSEIMSMLPTRGVDLQGFNNKFGAKLLSPINSATKNSLNTWWKIIRRYFWQGKSDRRQLINFDKELLDNNHLIISLGSGDRGVSPFVARTYCAKILQYMRRVWHRARPVLVFEEARLLFPFQRGDVNLSSNEEVYDLVTLAPKLGVHPFFIVQHSRQLFQSILENIHIKILGMVQFGGGGREYFIPLKYDPTRNIREFLYLDVTSNPQRLKYTKFRPCIPCMKYRSDR